MQRMKVENFITINKAAIHHHRGISTTASLQFTLMCTTKLKKLSLPDDLTQITFSAGFLNLVFSVEQLETSIY